MASLIARRLLWMVALLFGVSALTFLIFYVLPSADPAVLRAGRQPSPGLVEEIRQRLGLDEPVYVQFWLYLKQIVLHGNFGYSYQNGADVLDLIVDRLPATLSLAAGAAALWMAVAVPVGVVSAIKRRSWIDRLSMGAALLAVSAPVYWLGLVALYLFAADVGIVPLFDGIGSYVPFTEDPVQWFQSLLLPWIVLAASFAAIYARYIRASMTEAMEQDYIRTARAKGLPERQVLRHGLRASLTPVVTLLGLDIGILLGGAILTEAVFNIPGVGRLAINAIETGDLPMIQGTVLLGAFFIIAANLVVDVAYAYLDPRVKAQ